MKSKITSALLAALLCAGCAIEAAQSQSEEAPSIVGTQTEGSSSAQNGGPVVLNEAAQGGGSSSTGTGVGLLRVQSSADWGSGTGTTRQAIVDGPLDHPRPPDPWRPDSDDCAAADADGGANAAACAPSDGKDSNALPRKQ